MIFIHIFLFKINEIILLIIVYHNSEDLEEVEENHDTTYNNSLDFLDNEFSDQKNWFNGE